MTANNQVLWPPKYQLRLSKRAKHTSLAVTEEKGLEIITPYHRPIRDPIQLLSLHRKWIEKRLATLKPVRPKADIPLPERLYFYLSNQGFQLQYHAKQGRPRMVEAPGGQLSYCGGLEDKEVVFRTLSAWVRLIAGDLLLTYLNELSDETGIQYNRLSIRDQRTRWGSCSSKRDITLNYKLVFLPMPFIRYTLLHELCHIIHMNHSASFWQKLSEYDPHCRMHDKKMNKEAKKYIPEWLI